MVNSGDMHTILGVIGNVTSFLVFISPLPGIWGTWKNKEELIIYECHTPAFSVVWCIMWVLYSMPFVHPHSILVSTSKIIGVFIYIIYHIMFFLIFKPARRSMVAEYIAEFVFLAGLTWITLEAFDNHSTRSGFVGFFCDLFGIIDSSLDLACTVKLIRMKHVESGSKTYIWLMLHFLFRFLNGVVWSAYALIKFDIYILIDNAVGAAVGFIQLLLFAGYYCVDRFRTIKLSPIDDC